MSWPVRAGNVVLAILFVLYLPCLASAASEIEQWQQELDALNRKVGETTDPEELARLMTEMGEIAARLLEITAGDAGPMEERGATPSEEVDRVITRINRDFGGAFAVMRSAPDPEAAERMPLTMATKVSGTLEVTGKDSDPPYQGLVETTLSYTIREEFVGYLTITQRYGRDHAPIGEPEYSLTTFSTAVQVPSISGRQCVEKEGAGVCREWRSFDACQLNPGEVYPAIHEWVALGNPLPGGGMRLDVEVPAVIFFSADKRASRGTGCSGTTFVLNGPDMDAFLREGRLSLEKEIGTPTGSVPRCQERSRLSLQMTVCPVERFVDLADPCRQAETLLNRLQFLVKMRDAVLEAGKTAADLEEFDAKIAARLPESGLGDPAYLARAAGGYNFCSKSLKVPDYCRQCEPRPLCEWTTQGIQVHEQTHAEDAARDRSITRLICDSTYYGQFTSTELNRKRVSVFAELDYHAYGEQARYLLKVLEGLVQKGNCRFTPQFFTDLAGIRHSLIW